MRTMSVTELMNHQPDNYIHVNSVARFIDMLREDSLSKDQIAERLQRVVNAHRMKT